jgi:hypothetical protein
MPQIAFAVRPAASLWARGVHVPPPTAAVVDAVIAHGDLIEERGEGTVLIRVSPERVEKCGLRALLGDDWARALDVSVEWDEREEQIVRVLDRAPLRAASEDGPTGNAYADRRLRGFPRAERARAAA